MMPATVSEARQQTKHYCYQLKVLYKICVHFCHVYGPTSPDFHRIIRLQNWLSASWPYLQISCTYPLKLQYTHIVMIIMCVICRLKYASCIYDRWPIVVHISHQTQQKRPERTHHDQASSYKELCKGRATELYKLLLKLRGTKEKLFSTLSSTFFIILCVYHLPEYLMFLCSSNVL